MRQLEKPEAGPETGNGLDPLCRESPGAGTQPSHSLTSTYPCITCTYTETHRHSHVLPQSRTHRPTHTLPHRTVHMVMTQRHLLTQTCMHRNTHRHTHKKHVHMYTQDTSTHR